MSFTLNPRTDNFILTLPHDLIPVEVLNVVDETLLSKLITEHDSINDFIKESVKSIDLPDLGQPPAAQLSKNETRQLPKLGQRIDQVSDTTITITMRSMNGLVNYLLLRYTYMLRKFNPQYNKHVGDIQLIIRDTLFNTEFDIVHKGVTFDGISGLELDYDSNNREFKSFTLTFSFSDMDMSFNLAGLK